MAVVPQCPGSRAVREPTPVYIPCPDCGEETEVWTHELSYPCSKCGTPVYREQRPSCIDWCSYAKKCIGDEAYEKLKAETKESPAGA